MWKLPPIIVLALALSACAHHRQPKARCTGPLERINVSAPASTTDPSPHQQDAPKEEPKDEGNES
jgi:hypothetical protein